MIYDDDDANDIYHQMKDKEEAVRKNSNYKS